MPKANCIPNDYCCILSQRYQTHITSAYLALHPTLSEQKYIIHGYMSLEAKRTVRRQNTPNTVDAINIL